ncbi:hypothetical protein GCM10009593_21770 [Microlunatus antarcticus]
MESGGSSSLDEVRDGRPLRRLGLVSAAGLVAAVVVLTVHELRHDPGDQAWAWLPLVRMGAVLASLLLLGAVLGLWSRRVARPRKGSRPLGAQRDVSRAAPEREAQ